MAATAAAAPLIGGAATTCRHVALPGNCHLAASGDSCPMQLQLHRCADTWRHGRRKVVDTIQPDWRSPPPVCALAGDDDTEEARPSGPPSQVSEESTSGSVGEGSRLRLWGNQRKQGGEHIVSTKIDVGAFIDSGAAAAKTSNYVQRTRPVNAKLAEVGTERDADPSSVSSDEAFGAQSTENEVVVEQKPVRKKHYIPAWKYLNDPKLPERKWRRDRQGSISRSQAKNASKEVDEGGVRATVRQVMDMRHFEDVDLVLNGWEGKTNRKNFPLLIKELARLGDTKRTMKVFNWMQNQQCYRARVDIYAQLMALFARHGRLSQARALFYEMQEWRCKPDVQCYNALTMAYGRSGDWQGAFTNFDAMLRDQVPPSLASYNALLAACGSCGQWEKALEIFKQMEADGVHPNQITQNTILSALKNGQQYAQALNMFEKFANKGMRADTVTYNIVMSCYIKMGQFEKVAQIWESMKGNRGVIRPNLITYNTVMHAFATTGRSAEAQAIFQRVVSEGGANIVTYNTLIDAFATTGMLPEAKATFEDMKAAGLEPDVVSYSSLINAAGKAGSPDAARDVFSLMKRRSCRPNLVTYNAVIDACSRAGRLDEAEELKEEMEAAGIAPSAATFASLLGGAGISRQPEKIPSYFNEAGARGVHLNAVAYNALIGALLRCGHLEMIKQALFLLNVASAEALAKCGKAEAVKQTFLTTGSDGYLPSDEGGKQCKNLF